MSKERSQLQIARVQDIILDRSHPKYRLLGYEDSIGTILFTRANEASPETEDEKQNLMHARPFYYNISHYPIPNELVHVIGAPNDKFEVDGSMQYYYLMPMAMHRSPTSNAYPDILMGEKDNRTYYKGRYFEEQEDINPLIKSLRET